MVKKKNYRRLKKSLEGIERNEQNCGELEDSK